MANYKNVTVPSAMPEILTGIILAAGRIFGEAAAFLYTAGMSSKNLNFNSISLSGNSSAFYFLDQQKPWQYIYGS